MHGEGGKALRYQRGGGTAGGLGRVVGPLWRRHQESASRKTLRIGELGWPAPTEPPLPKGATEKRQERHMRNGSWIEECPDNLIHYFLVGVGCSSPKSVQFSRPYTHNPTTMMADHWLSLLLVLAYYCPLMPRGVPLHTLRCQRNSPAAAAFMRIRTTAQPTPRPLGPLLELCPLIYPLQLGLWVSLPPNGGPSPSEMPWSYAMSSGVDETPHVGIDCRRPDHSRLSISLYASNSH